jgi:membrane protease subunit HflK
VEDCQVRVVPPLQVKFAFEMVSTAEIERRQSNDVARAYASRVMSTAQGEADAVINQGKTEANRMLAQVAADAQYFSDQLPNFTANPELFKARLQAESMSRILTNVQERVFALPVSPDGERSELRMLLNPPPRRRAAGQ